MTTAPDKPDAPPAETGEGDLSESRLQAARAFAERWKDAGPLLELQRARELQELDDKTAREMMRDLQRMYFPKEFDDLGAGLVEQQRILEKLREREKS